MSDIPKGDDYKYNNDDDCGENGVCDRKFDGGDSDSNGGEEEVEEVALASPFLKQPSGGGSTTTATPAPPPPPLAVVVPPFPPLRPYPYRIAYPRSPYTARHIETASSPATKSCLW